MLHCACGRVQKKIYLSSMTWTFPTSIWKYKREKKPVGFGTSSLWIFLCNQDDVKVEFFLKYPI